MNNKLNKHEWFKQLSRDEYITLLEQYLDPDRIDDAIDEAYEDYKKELITHE
jgi:hypothetical protein